jgi:hypothetical protein
MNWNNWRVNSEITSTSENAFRSPFVNCLIHENGCLRTHRRENLKSYYLIHKIHTRLQLTQLPVSHGSARKQSGTLFITYYDDDDDDRDNNYIINNCDDYVQTTDMILLDGWSLLEADLLSEGINLSKPSRNYVCHLL